MTDDARYVLVGKFVGVHGIQGELKIESYTEPRPRIFDYLPWLLTVKSETREVQDCSWRAQGQRLLVSIPTIEDRTQALLLVGAEIKILRSAFPSLKEGEFYWTDLEGLDVITTEGVYLGKVAHLLSTRAQHDLLVVRHDKKERLLPFVFDHCVQRVDLEARHIVVEWDPHF